MPPPSAAVTPPVIVSPSSVTSSPTVVVMLKTRLLLSPSRFETSLAAASVTKVIGSTMSLPSASDEMTTWRSPASIVTASVICNSPNCRRMTSSTSPLKTSAENVIESAPGLSLANVMASRRERFPVEKSPSKESTLESTVSSNFWNSKAPMSEPLPPIGLGVLG